MKDFNFQVIAKHDSISFVYILWVIRYSGVCNRLSWPSVQHGTNISRKQMYLYQREHTQKYLKWIVLSIRKNYTYSGTISNDVAVAVYTLVELEYSMAISIWSVMMCVLVLDYSFGPITFSWNENHHLGVEKHSARNHDFPYF